MRILSRAHALALSKSSNGSGGFLTKPAGPRHRLSYTTRYILIAAITPWTYFGPVISDGFGEGNSRVIDLIQRLFEENHPSDVGVSIFA